jgi:ketosteroid isomerase-like protein
MADSTDRESVHDPQELARQLVSRENAGDVDGMAALYEPDAMLDCGGGRLAFGRRAIHEFCTELVAAGHKFELGDKQTAIISGNLALTSTRLRNGAITAEIARRQRDRSWLWAIDQPSIG